MALIPKMEIKQGQSLVMTPQLMQAIKLLQLSSVDLVSYVDAELERNPLLEKARLDERDDLVSVSKQTEEITPQDENWFADDLNEKAASSLKEAYDRPLEHVFPDVQQDHQVKVAEAHFEGAAPSSLQWKETKNHPSSSFEGGGADLENNAQEEPTLHEHLKAQLNLCAFAPHQVFMGEYLIDAIDANGYLSVDLEEIAERLKVRLDDLQIVLEHIHRFDPAGVGARSLEECLAIQFKERNRYDPMIAYVLENLDLVGKKDFTNLLKGFSIEREDLEEILAELKMLNPKPGRQFDSFPVQTLVPDVYVKARSDGLWAIELNSDALPKVLVNQKYYAEVSSKTKKSEEKDFIQGCLQDASWLVRSLDQRAQTILKVTQEIVRQQDAFLAFGVHYLRPLNLKTVADAIDMHESTVSRVTSNKYIATPRGVFELKYFFTSAIASSNGGMSHSAEAVRQKIKILIDQETVESILSDDKIVKLLQEEGVDIARRTVTKYREALGLGSSIERRREKKYSQNFNF